MIEYVKALYNGWCQGKTLSYIKSNSDEFVQLASRLLQYSPEEVLNRIKEQSWFLTSKD